MKTLISLLIILALFGCSSDIDKLQGHWHSINSNPSYTLDIKDSIAILNKLDRHGFYLEEKIQIKNDTTILPLAYNFSFNFFVSFNKDTLILKDFNSPHLFELSFLKYSENNNIGKHLSSDFNGQLDFLIELETHDSNIPIDTIISNNKWSMINIGYPKELSFPELDKDSLYLSADGIVVNYQHFHDFLTIEKEETVYQNTKLDTLDYSVLIINADKNTPERIFDSIYVTIEDLDYIKNIYRTCVNINEKTIGLYKLR